MRNLFLILLIVVALGCVNNYPADIKQIGNTTFIKLENNIIYIDPSNINDKTADFILFTKNDCDINIENISRTYDPKNHKANDTKIIGPIECIKKIKGRTNSILPEESFDFSFSGIKIEATYAYYENKTKNNLGYIISTNTTRIYFSGNTDFIEEMKNITNIDILIIPRKNEKILEAIKPKHIFSI